MNVMLYVGNLAKSVTESELRDLFSQVGEVTAARIIKDRISGRSQEYGFVTMSTQSGADQAVSRFNKHPLGDQHLRVGLVKLKLRTSSPGPRIAP